MSCKTASSWTKKAKGFPVGFAQVREDPLLDLNILLQQNNKDFSAIMIASGGCTAALLATQPIGELNIVDANASQLALTQLKLQLLENFEPQVRLALLGHASMATEARKAWIKNALLSLDYAPNTLGDLDIISTLGLDYGGRYEVLFSELQKNIKPYKSLLLNELTQAEKPSLNLLEALLKTTFEKVMSQANLVALYGKEATQNPVMPFWEHFFRQTIQALHSPLKCNNPFLSQMLFGQFGEQPYEWIKQPKQRIQANLNFENRTIKDVLKQKSSYYRFVHLSNALDWLSRSEAQNLLNLVEQSLTKGGVFILRQLNSTLDIPKLSPANIQWQVTEGDDLLRQDRSFFYRRLLIGRKA